MREAHVVLDYMTIFRGSLYNAARYSLHNRHQLWWELRSLPASLPGTLFGNLRQSRM